ncbi:MAG: PilZ domain-containing protein [Deltaproteobacteria bacterium]|nr:PilZ domain-containing protein [Deltaproteobacteria bacterium]
MKNVSRTGIGFAALDPKNLKIDDKIRVKFTLDDRRRSQIQKDAVVRRVIDNYLGCEFDNNIQFDKALGFYLMP